MPAQLTRECPSCLRELNTPEYFRDVGAGPIGRPPKVCRDCRAGDPLLQLQQERNVARRSTAKALQRRYARRSPELRATIRATLRPNGLKTCPAVSGCGRVLPLAAYSEDRHQADGLRTSCDSCQAERASLRLERTSS